MNPSFQEVPIGQIPALRFLQQLGYSYLSPEEAAMMRTVENWIGGLGYSGYESSHRPATPLDDAHQGGCFMYPIAGEGRVP